MEIGGSVAGHFGYLTGGTWRLESYWYDCTFHFASSPLWDGQTPLQDIAGALDIRVQDIREPFYDDPSLALLFSQLRSKTLQTAKGTSEISGRAEFNFVLQTARVFCRMGMSNIVST